MSDQQPVFPPPNVGDRAPDQPHGRPDWSPVTTQPQQSPDRSGTFSRGFGLGTGIGLGLGAAILVSSLALGAMLLVSSLTLVTTTTGAATTRLATIWGDGSQALRAVSVSGPILADGSDGVLLAAGAYGYEVAAEIDSLTVDDAAGVVLLVNTPGGSIAGSRAISDAVVRYQERTGQPVLVHVSSISASGGVYATAPANEILADHGAMVGSIGVIFGPFVHYDRVIATSGSLFESGVTTTGGITTEYLTAGEGKDFGNPYRAITQKERAIYQQGLVNEYDAFVSHVAEYRDLPDDQIRSTIGAHLYDTTRAEQLGLIDGVMGREEFFQYAAEAAGLDPADTRVEAIQPPSIWEAWLGVDRPFGVAPSAEQGDGISPVVSSTFCRATQPLAFAGHLQQLCG